MKQYRLKSCPETIITLPDPAYDDTERIYKTIIKRTGPPNSPAAHLLKGRGGIDIYKILENLIEKVGSLQETHDLIWLAIAKAQYDWKPTEFDRIITDISEVVARKYTEAILNPLKHPRR